MPIRTFTILVALSGATLLSACSVGSEGCSQWRHRCESVVIDLTSTREAPAGSTGVMHEAPGAASTSPGSGGSSTAPSAAYQPPNAGTPAELGGRTASETARSYTVPEASTGQIGPSGPQPGLRQTNPTNATTVMPRGFPRSSTYTIGTPRGGGASRF